MNTSKVKAVQGAGTYDSQYGTLYKFDYTMEDGTTLSANHKSQNPLPVGTEVDYEIRGTNDYGSYGKVSKHKEQYQKGGGDLTGIKVGHALNCASVLLSGTKYFNNKEAIKNAAKLIYEISEELNQEFAGKQEPPVVNKPQPTPPPSQEQDLEVDNDLPF